MPQDHFVSRSINGFKIPLLSSKCSDLKATIESANLWLPCRRVNKGIVYFRTDLSLMVCSLFLFLPTVWSRNTDLIQHRCSYVGKKMRSPVLIFFSPASYSQTSEAVLPQGLQPTFWMLQAITSTLFMQPYLV